MDWKRSIALFLTALMLLAPAACAVQGPDVLADPADEPAAEAPAAAPTEEPAEGPAGRDTDAGDEEAPAGPEDGEAPQDGETSPEEEPGASLESVLGAIEGSRYVDEYFDISFAPGDDWKFYSREDLLTMKDLAGSILEQYSQTYTDMLDQALDSDSVYFVMAAISPDGTQSVLTVVEDLQAFGPLATQQGLLEHIADNMGLDEDTMASLGLTIEINTCSLAGQERPGVALTMAEGGALGLDAPICQQTALLMEEDYAMQIAMTSLNGPDGLEEIAGAFSPAAQP